MHIFTDRTMAALQAGLSGEAQRQRVTSHNIANLNTPGYQARRVEFEGSLASALRYRSRSAVRITERPADPLPSLNGNSVSLEEETAVLVKSGLHYEALAQAIGHRFGRLSAAMGAR
jgi:flagellar basal-body rod protein FlgB